MSSNNSNSNSNTLPPSSYLNIETNPQSSNYSNVQASSYSNSGEEIKQTPLQDNSSVTEIEKQKKLEEELNKKGLTLERKLGAGAFDIPFISFFLYVFLFVYF